MKFRGKTNKPQEAASSAETAAPSARKQCSKCGCPLVGEEKFCGNCGTQTTVQDEVQNTPAEGNANAADVTFLWSGALWGCLADLVHREKFKQSKENYFLPMLGWDVLSFIVFILVLIVLTAGLYVAMDEHTVDAFMDSKYSDFFMILPLAVLRMRFLGKKSAQLFNKCLRSIDGTGAELVAYAASEKFKKREKSATTLGSVLWALNFIKP